MPVKLGGGQKSRLSPVLAESERRRLAERMAAHVALVLAAVPAIGRRWLLAGCDVPALTMQWMQDGGAGLNAELGRLAAHAGGPMLVIHADLPFLDTATVTALLTAAESQGAAIALDRAGLGTNALALARPDGFAFAFGAESYARHCRTLPHAATLRNDRLAFDIDTPADLAQACERLPWLAHLS